MSFILEGEKKDLRSKILETNIIIVAAMISITKRLGRTNELTKVALILDIVLVPK